MGAAMNRAWQAGAMMLAVAVATAAPAPERDPLLIGSKWKGKLTQRGTFAGGGMGPPEFHVVLTITKRDRNAFEAELHEVAEPQSLSITYLVTGAIARTSTGTVPPISIAGRPTSANGNSHANGPIAASSFANVPAECESSKVEATASIAIAASSDA